MLSFIKAVLSSIGCPKMPVYVDRYNDDVYVHFGGYKLLRLEEPDFTLTREEAPDYQTNFRRDRLVDELVRVLFAPETGVDEIHVQVTSLYVYGPASRRKVKRLVRQAVRSINYRPTRR